jgi:hypothetical protein
MKKFLMIGATLAALPMGVGVAAATSSDQGPPHPGCKPSHDTPPKCRTTSTVTVTTPGGTTTETVTEPGVTVTEPGTTVTVTTPAQPTPPPTVVVTQGPINNTVNITITINGVPQTITVPGQLPGSNPTCINTDSSARLGPLPSRFSKTKRVTVVVGGRHQVRNLLRGRNVNINVAGLECGVYPIVANDFPNTRAIVPVLRIWTLGAGKKITRAGFPDPIPPIGLS